jgi:hypothetical protein
MTTVFIYCSNCIHSQGLKCKAFPKGIPDTIKVDGFDHRKLLGGEVDKILFKPKPKEYDEIGNGK